MKTYLVTLGLVVLFNSALIAQNPNCNRSVEIKEYEKELPKEICIPKGNYHISFIEKRTDINSDGLEDFIFDWRKNPLQDGDTLYLTIYTQNRDSTFSHFKTFSNLLPLYFENYDRDRIPKNEKLKNLHKKYDGDSWLIELTFKNDTLEIIRRADEAKVHLIITYRYDKKIKNWRYEKTIYYNYHFNTKEPYELYDADIAKKLGPTVDNFTYFIYEE